VEEVLKREGRREKRQTGKDRRRKRRRRKKEEEERTWEALALPLPGAKPGSK
jgi:hypothetical protein